MTKQLKWAIGGLALLIVGFMALQIYLYVDMQQFKKELAGPEPKTETEQPPDQAQVPEVDKRPPPPADGHEYVWHGDHWDRVDQPHDTPSVQPTPVPKTYDGPLTYHEELLKTNPVKALRLQTEERGHWSAEWIPPFPPDDTEAQEFARNTYLSIYYVSIGEGGSPAHERANKRCTEMGRRISDYPWDARRADLTKICWPGIDYEVQEHYNDKGVGKPSNYFLPFRDPHPLANTPANKVGYEY